MASEDSWALDPDHIDSLLAIAVAALRLTMHDLATCTWRLPRAERLTLGHTYTPEAWVELVDACHNLIAIRPEELE